MPVRILREHGIPIAEEQSEKDFGHDPAANGTETRRLDGDALLNRNRHVFLVLHRFGEDVRPQWTVLLEHSRQVESRIEDACRIAGDARGFADQNVFVWNWLDAHRPRHLLS